MNIIDGLPSLARGAHDKSEGKACVMEYVSVLAGEEWSDAPKCTDHALASIAVSVNDALEDADRHLLVPYIARLVNTASTNMDIYSQIMAADQEYLCAMGSPCQCTDCCEERVISYETTNDPKFHIGRLDNALAAYDKFVGRTETPELSEAALRELAEAVAA